MCSLCTGDQSDRWRLNWERCFGKLDINALVTQEFHHLSPMKASLPVSPQKWMRGGKGGGREMIFSVISRSQRTALTRRGFFVAAP